MGVVADLRGGLLVGQRLLEVQREGGGLPAPGQHAALHNNTPARAG